MDTSDMWETLRRDYGIQTMDDLKSALSENTGIDIAVFTQRKNKEEMEEIA